MRKNSFHSILFGIIFLFWLVTYSELYASTQSQKQSVSGEVTVNSTSQKKKKEAQKKQYQWEKILLEKELASLTTALNTLNIELESLQIKASVARITSISSPGQYRAYVIQITKLRKQKKQITDRITSITKKLTTINTWLKRN